LSDETKKNPYEPATDECIEKWQVQVDCCDAKTVVIPVLRRELGGILARLTAREADLAFHKARADANFASASELKQEVARLRIAMEDAARILLNAAMEDAARILLNAEERPTPNVTLMHDAWVEPRS